MRDVVIGETRICDPQDVRGGGARRFRPCRYARPEVSVEPPRPLVMVWLWPNSRQDFLDFCLLATREDRRDSSLATFTATQQVIVSAAFTWERPRNWRKTAQPELDIVTLWAFYEIVLLRVVIKSTFFSFFTHFAVSKLSRVIRINNKLISSRSATDRDRNKYSGNLFIEVVQSLSCEYVLSC